MKERIPPDLMKRLSRGTPTEHKENTERTQREHTPDYAAFGPGEFKPFSVRLTDADKERLRAVFGRRGLTLSQGIRMVLLEYLERH